MKNADMSIIVMFCGRIIQEWEQLEILDWHHIIGHSKWILLIPVTFPLGFEL